MGIGCTETVNGNAAVFAAGAVALQGGLHFAEVREPLHIAMQLGKLAVAWPRPAAVGVNVAHCAVPAADALIRHVHVESPIGEEVVVNTAAVFRGVIGNRHEVHVGVEGIADLIRRGDVHCAAVAERLVR